MCSPVLYIQKVSPKCVKHVLILFLECECLAVFQCQVFYDHHGQPGGMPQVSVITASDESSFVCLVHGGILRKYDVYQYNWIPMERWVNTVSNGPFN